MITIESPWAGEVWYVGTTRRIRWTTANLGDVLVYFSDAGGAAGSWVAVTSVMEGQAGWLDYAWTVPDAPSVDCVINIAGYMGEGSVTSGTFEVRAVIDEDGDGMDDRWEADHFSDTSCDGAEDSDGDGLSNVEEFLGGTDPNDAQDADSAEDFGAESFSCAPAPMHGRWTPSVLALMLVGCVLSRVCCRLRPVR